MTTRTRTRAKLGAAALVLYLPHAFWHISRGSPWDLLWMCDVAMPLLALGCFAQRPRAVVSAFSFLIFGTPLWLLDVLSGGGMIITSPLIHVGGLVVATLAVREFGWPPRSWAFTSLLSAIVLGLSRALSPSDVNVNMAFRVYEGWEKYFSSHALYVAGLWLLATAIFWSAEQLHRRLRRRSAARAGPADPS